MGTMDFLKVMMLMMDSFDGFEEDNDFDELEKLDALLKTAGIPFENFGMQICYYGPEGRPKPKENTIWQGPGMGAICSVIAIGHGSSEGLLEISGLMTEEEMNKVHDTILGYLTAEDVFARIKTHYETCK